MTKIREVTYTVTDDDGNAVEKILKFREFDSGEMRGLSLVDLGQLKTDALYTLLPRITVPPMAEHEIAQLPASAMMAVAMEIGTFLLG